jgi:hypothetical protein
MIMRHYFLRLSFILAAAICSSCGRGQSENGLQKSSAKPMLPLATNKEELRQRLGPHTNEIARALANAKNRNYPAALAIMDHLVSEFPEVRSDQSNLINAAFPPVTGPQSRPRVAIEQLKPADRKRVDALSLLSGY